MAFPGAPQDGSINSDSKQTKVGTSLEPIFTATSTKVTQGSDGKVNGGTTTLYYSATPNNFVPAATSTDGGKTWTYLKDSSGKEILGADAKTSLETGALKTDTQAQIQSASTKAGIPAEQQKQLASSTANASTGSDNPPAEGSETLTDAQQKDADTTNADTRKAFSPNLYYPITLKTQKQDVLKIDMVEYKPTALAPSSLSGFAESGFKSNSEENVIGTVHLPIPAGISDSNGVSWQSDELNPIQAAGANFALTGVKEGFGAAANVAGEKAGAIQQNTGAVQTFIAGLTAGAATNTGNILSRTKGIITNPNMELLFSAPQLRQFAFTYKLSSRSKDESEMIRSIIRFFKQGMAVQRSASNLFLKAPHTFKLTYKHQNKDHIYLNKFKECALTNFSVDYTPEGQYATFTDGAMVSYQITLQFQELEPVFNDDYGNSGNEFPDPDIGY